jgi:5-aminopentanamidase
MSEKTPPMTVCGVQMDVVFAQPAANLQRMEGFAQSAVQRGARLVVFPECALTGYCFDSAAEVAAVAVTSESAEVTHLAELSRQLRIALIVGTAWRAADGTLRNAVLTFEGGQLVDVYFKVHLPFLGMDRFVVPGATLHQPLEIGGIKVGIHICYEGGFPEVARCLALAGADLVVLPTNWPPGSGVSCQVIPSCRALENRVYFLAVNRVGSEGGFTFIGNSSWSQPSGAEGQRLSGTEEGLLVAEIDPQLARQKRLVIQPGVYELDRLADRRPALYGRMIAPAEEAPRP